jgi:hypothetical protein
VYNCMVQCVCGSAQNYHAKTLLATWVQYHYDKILLTLDHKRQVKQYTGNVDFTLN